ncbi:7245_t:CDS:1, partial [Racocetra fulgida]
MSLSKPYNLDHFYQLIKDKKYITYLQDNQLSSDVENTIENYPYVDWNIDQLKYFLHQPTSTFTKCSESYPPYNVVPNRDPLDHWVAESMKIWDRELYDSLKGYTKLARLGRVYPSLAMFSRPLVTRKNVLSSERFDQAYKQALGQLRQLFESCRAETLSLDNIMKQIPRNSSAGYPYLGKKKSEVWDEVHKQSISNYYRLLRKEKIEYKPCVLALRGHLSPLEQNKSRAIWVVPFETIVMENLLFRNVYDYLYKKLSDVFLTGKNTLYRLRNYLHTNNGMDFINLDYSGWDAHRMRFVSMDVFDILKKCIQFKHTDLGSEESIFDFVRETFLESKLMLPDGSCYKKQVGTPSGSLLTT